MIHDNYAHVRFPDILQKKITNCVMDFAGPYTHQEFIERFRYIMDDINHPNKIFDFDEYSRIYDTYYKRKGIDYRERYERMIQAM